jgi:glycosyltransferase involved in cell wall biosynthesis
VSLLTEELVAMGHSVTLAASGDSTTAAAHFSSYPRSLRRAADLSETSPYEWLHVAAALEQAESFDVVHNHAGELAMAMAGLIKTPMLTTTHCLTTSDTSIIWKNYGGAFNTISAAQGAHFVRFAPPARFLGYVHHAVDVDAFPFSAKKGDDLLFLSRLAPEKGPQHAVAVAKRTGRRLILAGKVDRYDQRFFDEVVRDLIDDDQIVYVGEADARRKRELYLDAACLLVPITWEEPFGLVMPEAMACGTPVIAFRRGSAPEVVAHGRSGFVVDTVEEMAEAVRQLASIDPYVCREHVRQRFAPRVMAAKYVGLYERLAREATGKATAPMVRVPVGGRATAVTAAAAGASA